MVQNISTEISSHLNFLFQHKSDHISTFHFDRNLIAFSISILT